MADETGTQAEEQNAGRVVTFEVLLAREGARRLAGALRSLAEALESASDAQVLKVDAVFGNRAVLDSIVQLTLAFGRALDVPEDELRKAVEKFALVTAGGR